MTDSLTKERRSWNMSRIRAENTRPEVIVRSILHRLGYRFRLHVRKLPGRPDIVLPKLKMIIFVHGCFWHRHPSCKYAYTPKSRVDFWQTKFLQNIKRDTEVLEQLKGLGWKVKIIWECQVPGIRVNPIELEKIIRTGSSE
jgi:DNA mismatch endonuclease, patch repair protein